MIQLVATIDIIIDTTRIEEVGGVLARDPHSLRTTIIIIMGEGESGLSLLGLVLILLGVLPLLVLVPLQT